MNLTQGVFKIDKNKKRPNEHLSLTNTPEHPKLFSRLTNILPDHTISKLSSVLQIGGRINGKYRRS